MIPYDIFAIATEKDDRHCSDDEWFLSLHEAMVNRMKYANWSRPQGEVWIRWYHNGPRIVEEWYVNADGTIRHHYNWDQVKK